MMLAVSPNSVVRSSLEEMLESLQRKEEYEKEGKPPALPARPKSNSRTRPPSTTRRLPTDFEVSESEVQVVNGKRGEENGFEKEDNSALSASRPVKRIASEDTCTDEKARILISTNGSRRRFRESEREVGGVGYFSNKKFRVWCQPKDHFWQQGQIQSTTGEKSLVLLSDARVVSVNTQDILPANPEILDTVDNLVQLSYLNEPSVVHNLQCRYSREIIYTKAGPLVIALNPMKDVKLYGSDFITAYREKLLGSPHVYAVVDAAYSDILAGEISQSIIISGQTGSGKTKTAERALEYLAAVGGDLTGIGFKLLQTSYILEAFGNAKTVRNDNSSRFGKLIEIHFSAEGLICGANIMTFSVEKSRVVHLGQGERSYHIFYQLCAGAPPDLRGRLNIKSASEYKYLSQSNCLEIPYTDDAQKFHLLTGALNAVGICKEDQEHIFQLLAAVLWLGNISFAATDGQQYVEAADSEAVNNVCSLIGCGEYDLILALSTCKVKVGKDVISRKLTLQQATNRRDALAKLIYTSLFEWLVERINLSLALDKHDNLRSISILDICGFDISEKNTFDQFCINYVNERLQQHFLRHIFKLEQEEYESDGVQWTKTDFKDNKACLDLFEKKPAGLISILEEVGSLKKATKSTFTEKLRQELSAHHCFKGEKDGTFSISHFSGEAVYDASDFLEKNWDPLYTEAVHLLSSSAHKLPRCFSSMLLTQLDSMGRSSPQSGNQSLVSKLQVQLSKLFQHLDCRKPHFIYCIRPNNKGIPGLFGQNLVLSQLRSCSILEVLRVSKFGYPSKVTLQDFSRRYELLLPENIAEQDPLSMSIAILQNIGIRPEMYQVGYTKLYLRAGQINVLEDARQKAVQGSFEFQKCYGCHRRSFHEVKEAVTTLQSYVRGEIARKKFPRHNSRGPYKEDAAVPHASIFEELRRRVLLAEAALLQKENENKALSEQVEQLETRWPQYEAKMKSMEEMWQKQMQSLQMKLAAATKNVESTTTVVQNNGPHSSHSFGSEGGGTGTTSMGSLTPGCGTPTRCLDNSSSIDEGENVGNSVVIPLVREFEQQKQAFDREAEAIIGGGGQSLNATESVQSLNRRFEEWKKRFRLKLREAKVKARKMGQSESRWKWWGLKTRR